MTDSWTWFYIEKFSTSSGRSRGRVWGSYPPSPPHQTWLVWDWSSSSTESYITDFFNETRHNPRYWKMKLFWGTLFWVPASDREAALTAPTATGLHTMVFFNRNNSTALKNSYMFSATSLAFVCSLICVDCVRNMFAIIFVHEKWLTNGKQVFPSTAFCPWLTQGFPFEEKLILH